MGSTDKGTGKSEEVVITSRDILFECPACGKSLVVDIAAEGLIIECPQCNLNVIVPPKQTKPTAAPPPPTSTPSAQSVVAGDQREPEKTAAASITPEEAGTMVGRLAALAQQLKEMQAQRTELTNRIASRLNEINRDLVMMARLETSQQQVLSEWNQLVSQTQGAQATSADQSKRPPTVLGSSVSSGRTRVSFRT